MDWMGLEAKVSYRQGIILRALLILFPEEGYTTPSCWPQCAKLLPHAEKIIEKSDPSVSMAILIENMKKD